MKLNIFESLKRRAYEKTISGWTNDKNCILIALALYDKFGVKFSLEDEEPWWKNMVIRKNGEKIEEFSVSTAIMHRTIDEFEDKVWKIMNYGMPSIGCPPFSTLKELEMKLQLSGREYNICTQKEK